MSDRFEDIRTFVAVVQARGFAQAGKRLGLAKSAISRRVSDLEERLGTRLLHRTTRQFSPTAAGTEYYERGVRLLAELQEAEDVVSSGSNEPNGSLRISAPVSFGSHCLGPILPEFMDRFPRVRVELELEDRLIDLVASGFDVAVRVSRLKDSSLIARKIVPIRHVICASPDYLRRRGRPKLPADLNWRTTTGSSPRTTLFRRLQNFVATMVIPCARRRLPVPDWLTFPLSLFMRLSPTDDWRSACRASKRIR
jgi:DNA-binding transcriptional LysR family regulator